jgi:hypothetical protein
MKEMSVLKKLGCVVEGVFLFGTVCFGQGGQAPEWFYWFVDHPSSPLVLPIGSPGRILVGDFNKDGNADLIVDAHQGPYTLVLGPDYGPAKVHIVMLLGDGYGGFGAPTVVLETKGSVGPVLVADVNGDGHQDLVLAHLHIVKEPKTEIQAMLGDGRGGLQRPVTLFTFPDILMNMTVGDVNGDGHLDFVLAHNLDQAVSIFLGDRRGGFTYRGSIRLGREPDHDPYKVVLADFNRDGHLDLAVAGEVYEADDRRTRFVRVLLGDGTGDFPHTSFFIAFEPPEDRPPVWINLIAVDYNHDGYVDLITSRQDKMIVLLGRGDGAFENKDLFWVGDPRPKVVSVTDFNGDGCWDWVIALNSAPWFGLNVIIANCAAFVGRQFWWSSRVFVAGVVVADLNNDGSPDVTYATGGVDRHGNMVTYLEWLLNNIRRGARK